MVRPGVNVISRATPPARGLQSNRGTWFVSQVCAEGPANSPQLCRNLGDWTRIFGPREATTPAYDAVDTYFREGGSQVYFSRAVGPNPVTAFLNISDRAGAPLQTIKASAIGPGAYGLTISVQIQNGVAANTYNILVYRNNILVETSPDLASPTDGVTWSSGSQYIRVTDLASATAAPNNNPGVLAKTALGGAATDDRANIVDAQKTTALNSFTVDLGPGQVSYPGATTAAMHTILRAAAKAMNREAILDLPDTPTQATMTAVLAGVNDEYSAAFAPWVTVPGIIAGTTRIVPPSALVAGLIARSESLGVSPNQPAAGANGEARFALGVTQVYDDVTREALNGKGINVIKTVFGAVRLYGYRTNADPIVNPQWIGLGNQRLRLAITDEAIRMGENFVFGEIDGQRKFFARVAGAVGAILTRYWDAGDLYGPTPDDAFFVDTGPAVNTPLTIANNELHIVISAKMSPFAEYVVFEIIKLGISDTI